MSRDLFQETLEQRRAEQALFRNILLRVVESVAREHNASCVGNVKLRDMPKLTIDDVGDVPYPLSPEQARSIIAIAERAPFGKGTENVVDETVRSVWEVDATKVHIDESWLDNHLPKIVKCLCNDIDVMFEEYVDAKFYKLLIYEEGGHFKQHQDTERGPGMFGTLLVQLPSQYTGGDLVISHNGTKWRVSNAEESERFMYCTAFFSDCTHTLEPVTSGYRLVLVFNLFLRDASLLPDTAHPASFQTAQASLQVAANAWVRTIQEKPHVATKKLFYVLQHEYTRKNLSFINLKGSDHYVANTLRYAKDNHGQPLFQVYLVLLCKHEEGVGADEGFGRKRSHVEMERGCDVEVDTSAEHWVGPEGKIDLNIDIDLYCEWLAAYGYVEPDSEEQDEIFPDMPARKEYEGYMGNYAGTLEQWYYKAALAFWPVSVDFDVKISSNVLAALESLTHMAEHNMLFVQRLETVISEFEKTPILLLGDTQGNLLSLIDNPCHAHRVLKLYESIGLHGNQVAHALSSLTTRLNWQEIAESIREILTGPHSHHTSHGYALTLLGDLHKVHPVGSATRSSFEDLTYAYLNNIFQSAQHSSVPPSNICVIVKLIVLCPSCHSLWNQCEEKLLKRAPWNTILHVLHGCLSITTMSSAPEHAETRMVFIHYLEEITWNTYNNLPHKTVNDMLSMLQCLISLNNVSAIGALCDQFKTSSPTSAQFRQFLQDPRVKRAIHAEEGPLRQLVRHRIALLQELCRVPPTYDWAQPTATHPHADIQAFLRSADAARDIYGYVSIKSAREDANKYSGNLLRVSAAGTGKHAHLICHKISAGHVMEAYEANRNERNVLAAMLTTAEGPNIAPSATYS